MIQLVFLMIIIGIGFIAYKNITHHRVPDQLEKKKKELEILKKKKELLDVNDKILNQQDDYNEKLKNMEDKYSS